MKIYSSIEELPVYNYWKCVTKKDLSFLIIEDSDMLKINKDKKLAFAWEVIDDEIMDMNLQDPSYVMKLKEHRDHEMMKLEQTLRPTALAGILINDKNEELKRDSKAGKKWDLYSSIATMGKYFNSGFIDPKKLTVVQYLANISLMKVKI